MNVTLNFVSTFSESPHEIAVCDERIFYPGYLGILRFIIMKRFANLENRSLTHNRNSIPEAERRLSVRSGVCQSNERD